MHYDFQEVAFVRPGANMAWLGEAARKRFGAGYLPEYKLNLDVAYEDLSKLLAGTERHEARVPGRSDGQDAGIFRWNVDEDTGLVSFGFTAERAEDRPGHGGEWSSNSSSFAKHTGRECVELVAGTGVVFHMLLEQARKLVPKGFEYVESPHPRSYELIQADQLDPGWLAVCFGERHVSNVPQIGQLKDVRCAHCDSWVLCYPPTFAMRKPILEKRWYGARPLSEVNRR